MKKIKNLFKSISSNLNKILPKFLRKKELKESSNLIFQDHFDPTKTQEEKIKLEKRRRNQAYIALDYLLSLTTYFDFFSADAFEIAINAKHFTQILNKKIVTSDLLLLPFFYTDSKISLIFKDYGITKEKVEKIVSTYHLKYLETVKEENFFKNLFNSNSNELEEIIPNPKIKYSLEINRIFEKAAQNALTRFKTPVITTEILFITIMEEKNTRAAKIIKNFFISEIDWYLLRYNLIKRLHKHESFLRTNVVLNQHYFAYLLKTQFSDIEFENLIDNDYLSDAVAAFRNELISEVLKVDLYKLLEEDVYRSIKANKDNKTINTRIYYT